MTDVVEITDEMITRAAHALDRDALGQLGHPNEVVEQVLRQKPSGSDGSRRAAWLVLQAAFSSSEEHFLN